MTGAAVDPGAETVEALKSPSYPRDLSIDYLRTTLTLLVVAHHSSLAYTSWAFVDQHHLNLIVTPIADPRRWSAFDYSASFNDAFFMCLMFFISGLFVYPALLRHGTLGFMRDRALRLGVPFIFAFLVIMPIGYYGSWQLLGHDLGFADFYKRLAARGFAVGPAWFLWVLLAFDLAIAVCHAPLRPWLPGAGELIGWMKQRPMAAGGAMLALGGVVYLPLLFRYGFDHWVAFFHSPFALQLPRVGLYGLWFVFGFFVGVPGLSAGLLARDGALARSWPGWLLGSLLIFNAYWFMQRRPASSFLANGLPAGLLWLASGAALSFTLLGLFRAVRFKPHAWMLSLSRSAYGIYLVHYLFVIWTQRLLMKPRMHPVLKFASVFLCTTALSWLAVKAVLKIPKVKGIL